MKSDCKDLKNEYKNYSKLLDKVIKVAKFKFERNKIERSSKDPKKLWEIINNKLGKTKKANKTVDYIYANKNKIVNKDLKEKVGDVDGINVKTIKTIAPYIVTPLQHIFNLSIEHAIWPDSLKSAEVAPIHKAGAKSDISNYRPISLISNIANIFEKIIYNRLYSYLKDCNILSDSQYGFIKGKGTADALNKM